MYKGISEFFSEIFPAISITTTNALFRNSGKAIESFYEFILNNLALIILSSLAIFAFCRYLIEKFNYLLRDRGEDLYQPDAYCCAKCYKVITKHAKFCPFCGDSIIFFAQLPKPATDKLNPFAHLQHLPFKIVKRFTFKRSWEDVYMGREFWVSLIMCNIMLVKFIEAVADKIIYFSKISYVLLFFGLFSLLVTILCLRLNYILVKRTDRKIKTYTKNKK